MGASTYPEMWIWDVLLQCLLSVDWGMIAVLALSLERLSPSCRVPVASIAIHLFVKDTE
jgi:hypothetical protein